MCTSIKFKTKNVYFGRNLDLEYSFGEKVVITPRNYVFKFRHIKEDMERHYAMIGMAAVAEDYPLYAEAVNEKGLYMAGLNFPGNAFYSGELRSDKDNVASFELIPRVVGGCASVLEAKALLDRINITDTAFSENMPPSPLHWHIADRSRSIVLEQTTEGLFVYEDPIGVLTNNPEFDFHLMNLNQYMGLSAHSPENRFGAGTDLEIFGQGMGAIGLPGDCSPASRFVRAAFNKVNSSCGDGEEESVSQFFHILDSVAMVRGTVITPEGKDDITTYSCCINADEGIYYYKTYGNNRITAVRLSGEDPDSAVLKQFELRKDQDILYENR